MPLLKGDGRGGGEAEAFLDAFDGGHEALQDGRHGEAAEGGGGELAVEVELGRAACGEGV